MVIIKLMVVWRVKWSMLKLWKLVVDIEVTTVILVHVSYEQDGNCLVFVGVDDVVGAGRGVAGCDWGCSTS